MGVSGIGYGGFDHYALNGYVSIPNTAQTDGGMVMSGTGESRMTGTTQASAGQTGTPGQTGAASLTQSGTITGTAAASERNYGAFDQKALKRMGAVECQTCKNRTYQDGSSDMGVSFKAPGHIDPASSGAVVMSHEQEHVSNEKARAASTGNRVISQSVRIFTAVCPECGRVYVSGGETRTVTATQGSPDKTAAYKANGYTGGKIFNAAV